MEEMIDRVAKIANVLISDLHYQQSHKVIREILENIKDEYTLEEWNKFIRYVRLDETLVYESKEEIIECFSKY